MNLHKNKRVLLGGGYPIHKQGTGIGELVRRVCDRLLGKRAPMRTTAPDAAARRGFQETADLPREIACATEQEAMELCQSLVARGFTAEVHYDVYDYSWSVEVSTAAADRHASLPAQDGE